MPRRARFRKPDQPHSLNWRVEYTAKIPGRHPLVPGREFKVRGERGRFIFRRFVTNTVTGESWIDASGPGRQFRSIRPDRVSRVHNKKKRRDGASKQS